MLSLSPAVQFFLAAQYLGSAIVSFLFCLIVLRRTRISIVSSSLISFGLTVAIWDVLVYFHRTAEDAARSQAFIEGGALLSVFMWLLFFLTFLNLYRPRLINILSLLPAVVIFASYLMTDYKMALGAFGWTYTLVYPNNPVMILQFTTYVAYMIATIVVLIYVTHKAGSASKFKFKTILWAYVAFQVFGYSGSNILLQTMPDLPPIGGILYLLTFIVLFYSVQSKPKKVVLSSLHPSNTLAAVTNYLQILYSRLTVDDTLESGHFSFLHFIKECGMEEHLSLEGRKVTIMVTDQNLPMVKILTDLVDNSLSMIEKGRFPKDSVEDLINFMNEIYPQIELDLVDLLKKHEVTVRSSDILYRLADGKMRTIFSPLGFDEVDLERFSSAIGLTHIQLKHSPILLDFSTRRDYHMTVKDFVSECLSNGEEVLVFTRMESQTHEMLKGRNNLEFFFLSPTVSKVVRISEYQNIIPVGNLSQILGMFTMVKDRGKSSAIVFDNLSDFMLLTSVDQAYKLSRHALDILVTSNICSLFLLNGEAHEKSSVSALKALFKIVV